MGSRSFLIKMLPAISASSMYNSHFATTPRSHLELLAQEERQQTRLKALVVPLSKQRQPPKAMGISSQQRPRLGGPVQHHVDDSKVSTSDVEEYTDATAESDDDDDDHSRRTLSAPSSGEDSEASIIF